MKTKNKVVFSLRIDEAILNKLKEIAQKEKRSINAQMEILIENAVIDHRRLNSPAAPSPSQITPQVHSQ